MHNLQTVILFEFVRTLKKKTFWLSLLAFPALIGAVFGVTYLSSQIAEQTSREQQEEGFSTVYLDESGLLSPQIMSSLKAQSVSNKEEGLAKVKSGRVDAFIYYPDSPSTEKIEVYAKDAGLTENAKYTAVAEELLRSSASARIESPELLAITRGNISSSLTTYADGEITPGFERVLAPGLFLLLFYALIVLLSNQMLTSTTEEKENRVIEMILTTVEAKTLIVGKIIALIMLGLVQVAVITLPFAAAYALGGDALASLNLPTIDLANLSINWMSMAIGATIFVLSFLFFTGILVAIGAAVPTAKEANNFFGVVILSMMIPLYTAMAVVSDPSQPLVKAFSFFPLTAPVTLLLRNAVGNLELWEALAGIGIIGVGAVLALAIAARTFKYGTLEYSRKLSLKEIFSLR
jgi:ABC-2 type transport system permease protein